MVDRTSEPLLKIGSKHTVTVQGIGSRGEALARIGQNEVFIPKLAPFDEAEIEIIEKKKGRFRGRILRIVKMGPDRQIPRCRHFEVCGGCDFQHLTTRAQEEWKLRMAKHWARRSPLARHLSQIKFDFISSPHPFHYRHRVRVQVRDGKLHFFKPHSNEVFEVTECPILVEGFFEELRGKAQEIGNAKDWNQSCSPFRGDGGISGNHTQRSTTFISEDQLETKFYEIDGFRIEFDDSCFTQANHSVNVLMWKRITEDFQSLSDRSLALDLYCGVGNFTFGLAKSFPKVIAVESESKSIEWGKQNELCNRRLYDMGDIHWVTEEAELSIENLLAHRILPTFVLLDPPRMGALNVTRRLPELWPERITYVSCNLETLVRDVLPLTARNRYRIDRWTVVDLFPQTHHIESVVSLIRAS